MNEASNHARILWQTKCSRQKRTRSGDFSSFYIACVYTCILYCVCVHVSSVSVCVDVLLLYYMYACCSTWTWLLFFNMNVIVAVRWMDAFANIWWKCIVMCASFSHTCTRKYSPLSIHKQRAVVMPASCRPVPAYTVRYHEESVASACALS